MDNKIFTYNGHNITFQLGNGDVMVNATEMAKPFGKTPHEYLRLPSTNELFKAIAGKSRISENQLVRTKFGSSHNGGGTWLHEDVAIDFAQWLSVDFRLWVNDRIKELLKHGFTATEPKLDELVNNPDLLIQLATQLKTERAEKARLQEQNLLQKQELIQSAPKVEYYNEVLQSQSTYVTNQIAKELGTSAITLNRKLQAKRVIYRQNGTYLLYQQHQNKGYTKTKTHTYTDSNGIQRTAMQLVWTEKGRNFIHKLFKIQQS